LRSQRTSYVILNITPYPLEQMHGRHWRWLRDRWRGPAEAAGGTVAHHRLQARGDRL